jgi:hypothetical protein
MTDRHFLESGPVLGLIHALSRIVRSSDGDIALQHIFLLRCRMPTRGGECHGINPFRETAGSGSPCGFHAGRQSRTGNGRGRRIGKALAKKLWAASACASYLRRPCGVTDQPERADTKLGASSISDREQSPGSNTVAWCGAACPRLSAQCSLPAQSLSAL